MGIGLQGSRGVVTGRRQPATTFVEVDDQHRLTVDDQPIDVFVGTKGIRIGCHFVTHEAWAKLKRMVAVQGG